MSALHTQWIKTPHATETLIFLHDAWGCISMWTDFPQTLATHLGMNALLYDRAGHGLSHTVEYYRRPTTFFHDEAHALIALMDREGIAQATLFGFSDGGTIALVAAALYPERITGLILQSAHTCIEPEGLAIVAQITERSKHTRLLQNLAEHHGSNIPTVFHHWSRMWADERFQSWSIIPEIEQITCPIISYRGTDDPFDTVRQQTTIEKHTQGAIATTLIPQAGHAAHKDNPTATLAFILKHKLMIK